VVGEFGAWSPIGAIQTAGGYDVAWKLPGTTPQYAVWTTDSNGNFIATSVYSGTSLTLESLETTFHQDLNGDGVIGVNLPTTVIQTDGSTSLTEVGTNYCLYTNGSGPSLNYGGAPVVVGEFGAWSPIGAIQTAGGYDVAWKLPGTTPQYAVWTTDSSGNFIATSVYSGTSTALESLETTFHQDLNGDGIIGVVTTVIQTDGSTSLTEIGNSYYLYTNGSGPALHYGGAPVVVGEFGAWSPTGAIQTAGGYDLAWKLPGTTPQFAVWTTDSNGNFIATSVYSGTSTALEALETTFHQDLNGDGIIGIPPAASPASVQLASAHTGPTAFDGSTLTLENPSTFHGQIIGFSGDGTLAGSDQIDLHGLNFNSIHSAFDGSTGTLTVSGGSTTTSLQFLGHYSQDNFHFADDGNGGTMVYAAPTSHQPAATSNQIAGASPAVASIGVHDTFVFAPNFGQVTIANFAPATDTIQFSKSVFANVNALLAATHDDPSGNAVITDAAHDTITIGHLTTAQLLAHQNDFHIV
jgi:serralysin